MWILVWPSPFNLDTVIGKCKKRIGWNLVKDRDSERHLKAVDCASGGVLGYARWVLPVSLRKQDKWPVCQVPDVSDEEEVQLRGLLEVADWTFATGWGRESG